MRLIGKTFKEGENPAGELRVSALEKFMVMVAKHPQPKYVRIPICPTPAVDYRLPRPLWLLQEELQEHLRCEPIQKEAYLHTNWERRKEALESWIEIGKKALDTPE